MQAQHTLRISGESSSFGVEPECRPRKDMKLHRHMLRTSCSDDT